ncbi:GNAT family N-acetyltransferase [Panacibacter ginsenosidivorans]|uniref:GNAT family N-acetyltransferase n=1 Tax=Panacibacter ginsenosidivorans TaxID=1813871 RepID=A0A5B8V5M3_9BACT|nr:GNAT family N-acetyltransferase [Panacibacter ginsenosidivorans]QEC66031.1 GNAT family N-acetyltransferase [Panacibacter ginsenosidivorans]
MSFENLTIVKAFERDIPLIQQLTYAVWPQTYKTILTQEQIEYMLNMMYSTSALSKQINEGHQFIFVQEENKSVAFASYGYYKPSIYKLHKIYALPDQQGKGIGRFIVNYVLSQIKPLGARGLQLNVNRYNKAKGFYEKLGFKVIAEEDIDIGNGYLMNDYVMEMKL